MAITDISAAPGTGCAQNAEQAPDAAPAPHANADPAGAPSTPRRRPLAVKIIAVFAVLFTAWHVFASFLWIYPPSPLRQLTPGDSLSSYMLPVFGQSWTVFAPEPINGDYHLNVRAVLEDEAGETLETAWVSANQVELSMVINHLFPPRAGIQSEELASSYMNAWYGLNDQQHEVVADDFLEAEWQMALGNDLEALSVDETSTETDADQDPVVVEKFLHRERQITAYATQVAKAMWGDDVERVQFRVSRQNVVPFAQRNDPDAQRPDPSIVLPGWREPFVMPGQDEAAFADVFQRQYERLTGVKVER